VVLDDDPTGTQESTGIPVLLRRNRRQLAELLEQHRAVHVLTNTRALTEPAAQTLLVELRADIAAAQERLGMPILVVQRGDSTLRGHVFAEIEVFAEPESLVVFVPAFPAGGRRTSNGVHEVLVDGDWVNAADTEFARDPVFGYSARTMREYVAGRSSRTAVSTPAADFAAATRSAPPGAVVVPDVASEADLQIIGDGVRAAIASGRHIVLRCAAPLAALLCGTRSTGLIDHATFRLRGPVLVVAGSHTALTTGQLEALTRRPTATVEINTDAAVSDPEAEAGRAGRLLRTELTRNELVLLRTERARRSEHATLDTAARVMGALAAAVRHAADLPGYVIAKGGITSAEVAMVGFGAKTAWVQGQAAVGISLWTLAGGARRMPYLVVPGNMGERTTLASLVADLVDR